MEDQCNGRAKNRLLCNGRAKKREAEAQPGWAEQWNGKEERREGRQGQRKTRSGEGIASNGCATEKLRVAQPRSGRAPNCNGKAIGGEAGAEHGKAAAWRRCDTSGEAKEWRRNDTNGQAREWHRTEARRNAKEGLGTELTCNGMATRSCELRRGIEENARRRHGEGTLGREQQRKSYAEKGIAAEKQDNEPQRNGNTSD